MSAHDASFATENDARAALVASCLRMNAEGLNQGRAGNQSLRWHRGGADGMLVTPSAIDYEALTQDDIVWMPLAPGAAAAGAPGGDAAPVRAPSSEWAMHREVYLSQAAAGAVVHAHPPFAAALSCTARVQREGIPAFHYMVAVAGGDEIRCARYETFGSDALSAAVRDAMRDRRACLLANHGVVAAGATLRAAFALALEVEALCRMYLYALQAGEPVILSAGQMREVHARFGASAYGRFD